MQNELGNRRTRPSSPSRSTLSLSSAHPGRSGIRLQSKKKQVLNKLWWYPQQQFLMPRLTTWAPCFFAHWFCPSGQCHHQKVFQTITWLLLSSNSPEPSGTYLWNLHQHTPEPSRTFREPSGTLRPSGSCLRNLHQHLPELSRTGAYTSTHWSTHRNPQHTGTLRNLPEQAPGT